MIIIYRHTVDDHSDSRQLVDRVEAQRSKPNAAGEPGGEVRVGTGPTPIRVRGDEVGHREARTLHQAAAQRLTGDVLATDLTPTVDRDVAQYHRHSVAEVDR
jgi:hypothetical protein